MTILQIKGATFRPQLFIHDDLLGNDVDHQCVSRGHVIASWLSDDLHTSVSREILVQGWVDDSCDLERRGHM